MRGVVMLCLEAFFFFLQEEDGIRDYKVTGFQTCALPICDYGIRHYLTRVDYDDGTYASYTYQTANVASNPPTTGTALKAYQLIKTCNDVRYAGPMSQIEYQFEQAGDSSSVAFGQVKAEKNANTHQVVSQVQYPTLAGQPGSTAFQTRVETRGDGFSRTFA